MTDTEALRMVVEILDRSHFPGTGAFEVDAKDLDFLQSVATGTKPPREAAMSQWQPIERRMLADPVFDRAYKTLYAIATGQFGEGPAMDLAAATLTRLDSMAKEADAEMGGRA